jgi:flagellar motor switch protein FliM/N
LVPAEARGIASAMGTNALFGFEPYPWQSRRSYDAVEVRERARALRQIEPYLAWAESIGLACEDKLKHRFTLSVARVDAAERLRAPLGFVGLPLCLAEDPQATERVVVYVQNSLAMRLLKVAYNVDVAGNDHQPLDETAIKRVHWLVPSIVRRLGVPWQLSHEVPAGPFAQVTAHAKFHQETFQVLLFAPLSTTRPPERLTRASLAGLGALPLSLPVVASVAGATDDDLAALEPGGAWAPGEETWTLRPAAGGSFRGSARLVAPAAELGPEAQIEADGSFRVRELRAPCPWDASFYQAEGDEEGPGLRVVRVEVGRVTMTAREWAALAPGAPLPLPRGDGALLRVGGSVVARGRLARVAGELAVRIEQTVAGALTRRRRLWLKHCRQARTGCPRASTGGPA